jgi:hypothetical protein
MNQIREYWPNFVSVDREPQVTDFDTLEQLREIPFVKRWIDPSLKRFKVVDLPNGNYEYALMAEMVNDRSYVVGYLKELVTGIVNEKGE